MQQVPHHEAAQPIAEQDLASAQPILDKGCVGHNYYRFYVSVAEYHLICNRPLQARQSIQCLEQYTATQPCPWSEHFIQLVQCHADWLASPDDSSLQQAWLDCFAQGKALGLAGVTPRLLAVFQQQGGV